MQNSALHMPNILMHRTVKSAYVSIEVFKCLQEKRRRIILQKHKNFKDAGNIMIKII